MKPTVTSTGNKHYLLLFLICLTGIRVSAQEVIETIEIKTIEAVYEEPAHARREVLDALATRNLAVGMFRNGDSITHAQSYAEWKNCSENQKPCWCYYQDELTDSVMTSEVLYNYFAVTDKRGLAPKGWRIPSIADIRKLADKTYTSETWKRTWGTAIYDSVYCLRNEEFANNQVGSRNAIGIKPGSNFGFMASRVTRRLHLYYYWTVSAADTHTAYALAFGEEDDPCIALVQKLKGSGMVVRCIKE